MCACVAECCVTRGVLCELYVNYMFMCGVVLCGICVLLRTVLFMCYLSFLASFMPTLKICENGLYIP